MAALEAAIAGRGGPGRRAAAVRQTAGRARIPTVDDLWALADAEGLRVIWAEADVLGGVWARIVRSPALGVEWILLDRRLESRPALLKVVLAHEIGHHRMPKGLGPCVDPPRIRIARAECASLGWMADYLLPEPLWSEAVTEIDGNPWFLAERFGVPVRFVLIAAKYRRLWEGRSMRIRPATWAHGFRQAPRVLPEKG